MSNLDTPQMSYDEARARTDELQDTFRRIREPAFALMLNALGYGISVAEVVMAWTRARMKFEAEYDGPDEARAAFRVAVFDYLTTVVMWPETLESVRAEQGITEIQPSPEERAMILDALVNIFAEPVEEGAAGLVGAE